MGEIEFYEKIKDWDFSNINRIEEKIDTYISENKTEKGILLNREYYGITAIK